MEVALPEAVVLWVAAVTSAALATPATTKVLAMPVRARTGATLAEAPTVAAMLMTEAATVEAGATVVVIAATQPAPAIRAITAMWVVLARARMEVTSAVAPKGAVTLVTKEAMAAAAVTTVAGTAVERSRRSEKLLNSGAFGPRLLGGLV